MKLVRSFLAANLIFSLVFVSFLTLTIQNANAQSANIALQRGYRTGYSDGYMEGYRDVINNVAKNFEGHSEYSKADRAYVKDYGSLEDYRDGYQQGFEIGYSAGFEKRNFDAALPTNLTKRGIREVAAATPPAEKQIIEPVAENNQEDATPVEEIQTTAENDDQNLTGDVTYEAKPADGVVVDDSSAVADPVEKTDSAKQSPVINTKVSYPVLNNNDIVIIPADTELVVELLDPINTEQNREGDSFKAKVVSPSEISGAIIEGRIDKIRRPGRIKRRAELLLSFDRIILSQDRWSNFDAIVTEVLPVKGDNIKRVDGEGTMEGDRPYKGDLTKLGASTGTGAVVGGLIGGPVGLAIGSGVGAAFGVGAIVVDRGKNINLVDSQQLRIKSSFETQIR
ncbi:MAG: glycine zipper family protein [Pyrinomonadaceae bacterium]